METSSFRVDTSFSSYHAAVQSTYHFNTQSPKAHASIHPRTYGHLTCRRWKNRSTGCSVYACMFLHYYTGTISPPLPYTCWFWENSSCRYNQDECIYSHFDVGMKAVAPRHFRYNSKLDVWKVCPRGLPQSIISLC